MFSLFVLLLHLSHATTQWTPLRRLYESLFADYQKELRPVRNDSHTLEVKLKFWLKQILKVDENNQVLTIYAWLELYWTDEHLRWDPSEVGGLEKIHVPSAKLWKPDVLVYNSANMNVEDSELETNAIVSHTGQVILFRSMITDITCNMDLEQFPFDQQVCYMTFASWSMDGSKIDLRAMENTDSLELYVRNSEWALTDFNLKTYIKASRSASDICLKVYECCPHPFPDLTYFLVITVIGFFTPHSTTGENTEKVSLGVTALLSMAIIMMMVSDEVPATSQSIPLIGVYYIGLIVIISVASFSTTLTLSFQMSGNAGTEVPTGVKIAFIDYIARNPYVSWAFSFQLPPKPRKKKQKPENCEGKTQEHTFFFENPAANGKDTFKMSTRRTPPYLVLTFTSDEGAVQEERLPHIVKMEDLTELGALYNTTPPLCVKGSAVECGHRGRCPQMLLDQLRESLDIIQESLMSDRDLRRIQFEWQQVTRIIERLIMFVYVLVTIAFAAFMLITNDPDIALTDEVMDRVKM